MNARHCFALFAFALSLGGCGHSYRGFEPIAHHTVKATADTESDVVWIQEVDSPDSRHTLLRCIGTGATGKCERIKTE